MPVALCYPVPFRSGAERQETLALKAALPLALAAGSGLCCFARLGCTELPLLRCAGQAVHRTATFGRSGGPLNKVSKIGAISSLPAGQLMATVALYVTAKVCWTGQAITTNYLPMPLFRVVISFTAGGLTGLDVWLCKEYLLVADQHN